MKKMFKALTYNKIVCKNNSFIKIIKLLKSALCEWHGCSGWGHWRMA